MTEERHPESLLERVARWATDRPEQPAVIDLSGSRALVFTYRELWEAARATAAALAQMGVVPGEVVVYQLPNWWEFAALTLATWLCQAVVCPVLPSFREHELDHILRATGARRLFAAAQYRGYHYQPLMDALKRRFPDLAPVLLGWPRNRGTWETAPGTAPLGLPELDRPAQLLFTSGTTGEPKGVVHTHRTLAYALAAHSRTLGLGRRDTILVPSPMAHQTGFLYGMALAWQLGATAVYLDHWNPTLAGDACTRYGVRFIQAATPFLADLCNLPKSPPVALFVATGAAVPRHLLKRARERLRGAVVGGWGSTESGLVTVGRPGEGEQLNDGRPLDGDGIEAKVVDDAGRPLPPGQEGHLWVKTPAMFTTYLHHPDWYRAAVDPEGYFHTGDLAVVVSPAGHIRLTGREKDLINRGGEKIPVVEVEELLLRHPAVRDAALVAMPDERLGERACAFVVFRDPDRPLGLEALCRYLSAAGLAKPYWPERLEPIAALPRTASGKVQKYLLREWIRERLTDERPAADLAHPIPGPTKER